MHFLPHLFFFFLLIIPIFIAFAIFYILTLQKALSRCAPQNRATSPESVWLLLIPFFNMIWQFILYPRISESLEKEFLSRHLPIEPEPAKKLGLAVAVLHLCWFIPVVHVFTGIAGLVCLALYWQRISDYSNRLAYPAAYSPAMQPPPAAVGAGAFCTKCGGPMQVNERFCQNCGAPVA